MALDFGTTDNHTNSIHFGDVTALDVPTNYAIGIKGFQLNTAVAADRSIFGKRSATGNGWLMQIASTGEVQLLHDNGTSATFKGNTVLNVDVLYTLLVVRFSSGTVQMYINDLQDVSQGSALSQTIGTTTANLTVGNETDNNNGAACSLDHILWWDSTLTAQEAITFYAGGVPKGANLQFWATTKADPSIDIIGEIVGTKTGTVTAVGSEGIAAWMESDDDSLDKQEAQVPAVAVADVMPAGILAEFQKVSPLVYPILEMDLPNTIQYAAQDIGVNVRGTFKGKVVSFSSDSRAISPTRPSMSTRESGVVIEDTDKEFSNIVEGGGGNQIRGGAIRIIYVSPNTSDEFTYFEGRIYNYEQTSPLLWNINFRPDQVPLDRPFPKTRISQFDWVNAHVDALGQYTPLIWGVHSSVLGTDNGSIPLLPVDTVNFRYLVCLGIAKAVDNVYKDEAIQAPSAYAVEYPIINGRQFTVVNFTSDPGEDAAITADVQGYESVGDGSGTVLINPAEQVEHGLTNFVYGDYQSGSWIDSSTAPIDQITLANVRTFMGDEVEGYEGAIYLDGKNPITGSTFVNTWLKTWEMRAFWTNDGKIGFAFFDHRLLTLQNEANRVRWDYHVSGGERLSYDVTSLVTRIVGRYLQDSVENKFLETLEVRDEFAGLDDVMESLDMTYGIARRV